jgi:hypothetical protein
MANSDMKKIITGFLVLMLGATLAGTASATLLVDVTYTDGELIEGDLQSFGLDSLPEEVHVEFVVGDLSPPPEPGDVAEYAFSDVLSAEATFGDVVWTELIEFTMEIDTLGVITTLSYEFAPVDNIAFSNDDTLSITENSEIITSDTVCYEVPKGQSGGTKEVCESTKSPGVFEAAYSVRDASFAEQVPEPTTLALLSLGLAGLGIARRRVRV